MLNDQEGNEISLSELADENKSGAANAAKFLAKETIKTLDNRQSVVDIWSAEGNLPDDENKGFKMHFF